MTAGETSHCSSWMYSSILLPVFSHGTSGQNRVPRGRNRVWFESCPIFGSVAFKCSLSSCAACCSTSHSACLPGGPPLGQVSYCQDCSLNTLSPHHHHHHTHTLQVVHYCACQPSVQSILPLRQRAHMWWKAKREERRRTERVKKGCWMEKREERGRKAGGGSVSDGECRARGQRVKEQGKKERWQEKCPETGDKQQRAVIYNKTQR